MKYITPYITPHTSGYLSPKNTGIGNALFQIATCYGIAHKYNINVIFNNVYIYCNILNDRFNFKHKDTILRNIYNLYNNDIIFNNTIYEAPDKYMTTDKQLIEAITCTDKNSIIWGYLESTQYFKGISLFLIDLFQPDEKSYSLINIKYGHIFNNTSMTPVSLHFRGNESILLGHYIDYTYYQEAIKYILNNTQNPIFFIFTDDYNRIDISIFDNIKYISVSNEYDYLDLWTMSMCKHNINSHSTFSWWGAFLNKNPDKIVLYNKKYKREMNDMFTPI